MSKPPDSTPEKIVNHMLKNDAFSRWMGIELIEVDEEHCTIQCTVRKEMMNGFNVAHGGIIFSIADSAIAFASASYGRVALAVDHSISFIKKVTAGDVLTAKAETVSMGHKIGVIHVEITNQKNELIAIIKGTVYRSSKSVLE